MCNEPMSRPVAWQTNEQEVMLRSQLVEAMECNKDLNTEYQLQHQELQQMRQQLYNQLDKVAHLTIQLTKRDEEIEVLTTKLKMWKQVAGILEDMYTKYEQLAFIHNLKQYL